MNQDSDAIGQLRRLLEKHVPDIAFDVVRWSESLDRLIGNLIAPNRILEIYYDEPTRQARITLQPGQRERSLLNPTRLALASELVGWQLIV